uniref:Uncharacterized protein n=1 Tax=Rhizophagus irregularis (strain DAOM 181602 / DAOM 197198 / MUCL 43194) TaxID=747089 RepID=U9TBA7_RHIID
MEEFVEANKFSVQKQTNTSTIQYHSQAYYTSRKLTEILVQEESQERIIISIIKSISLGISAFFKEKKDRENENQKVEIAWIIYYY